MEPYSDDNMTFDENVGQYVLTEKAIMENCAIDLRSRLTESGAISPDLIIGRLVRTVSDMVYGYIHKFNVNNPKQDRIIATVPSARTMIRRAMEYQAEHVMLVGNLTYSEKPEERQNAINELCKSVLETVLPELGRSILYSGVI